jgi:YVTN family beta-propeller protein
MVATLCVGILLVPGGDRSFAKSASAAGPATTRIYVSNHLDDTVSVIDGTTGKTVAAVRVGVAPTQMAVSPDRRSVYIANAGSNSVSVLNTTNNTIAKTIALPRKSKPIGLALSPDGRYLYTADGGSNRVSVLDTRTKRAVASVRVGTQPVSVAVAANGNTVYAANSGSGDVSVIDARTKRVVRSIRTGRFPSGVAVTPDRASLYVTNELSGVTVINAASGTVEARLRAPSTSSVAVSRHGDRAYVTNLGPGTLMIIDTSSHQVSSTVSIGPYGTDPFTVVTSGDAVYVANQGANTLSVIDPSTSKVTATFATGNTPYGIAVVQPSAITPAGAPLGLLRHLHLANIRAPVRPASKGTRGACAIAWTRRRVARRHRVLHSCGRSQPTRASSRAQPEWSAER